MLTFSESERELYGQLDNARVHSRTADDAKRR